MPAKQNTLDDGINEALVPRWHESFYPVDLMLLVTSPVFYGSGIPKGDGSPVVVIPGFTHGDTYLLILYHWLARIGYKPYFSGIGFNAECPNILARDFLEPVIERARRETGKKVHLVGHSLGGILARGLAVLERGSIASVITLGSPYKRNVIHPDVLEEAEIVRRYLLSKRGPGVLRGCYTWSCECAFMRGLRNGLPKSLPFTAIYTVNDGLVSWQHCKSGRPGSDFGVRGTHAGLAFNPAVYEIIARRLASAGTPRMRARSTTSAAA